MKKVVAALVALAAIMGAMAARESSQDRPGNREERTSAVAPLTVERAVDATIRAAERARVELRTVYRGLDPGGGTEGDGGGGSGGGSGGGGGEVCLVQRAAFDRATQQAQASSDMSELAAALDAAPTDVPGDYTEPTRLAIDDGTVYAQLGPMAREFGLDPTAWVAHDLDDLATGSVDNETMALLLQPLGMLQLLILPVSDVQVIGADEVRGVRTAHLSATVDVTSDPPGTGSRPGNGNGAADGPGAGHAAADEPITARFRSLGLRELAVELWLSQGQVIHRLEFTLGAGPSDPGVRGVTSTFELYDVGEPLDLRLPGPDEVVGREELAARITGR